MSKAKINIPKEKLAGFCRKYHIRKLSLFGSVLSDEFQPHSDVDVLVEFTPGQVPGFLKLYEIEQELQELLNGHKPDLVTEKFLNHRIRDQVLSQAECQYAA